jgi:release factor glutamine methyltransferase
MTVRQLTTDLSTALQALYPEAEAAAMAGIVAEHLLGLSPLQRRMQAAEPVPAAVLARLPELHRRLLRHEPVQYVLGVADFAGLELEVTPATLIPRPETEELVQLIGEENRGRAGLTLLDVGTGSGCIPLALSRLLALARSIGVDVSAAALAVARRNAARYAPAVEFEQLDILTQEPQTVGPATLDILVSNPPYVLEKERALMRPNVLDFEPATALFVPDHDPLLFYRRIAGLGRKYLKPGGGLYFEINEQYAAELEDLLCELGYEHAARRPDLFGKDRLLRATWPG